MIGDFSVIVDPIFANDLRMTMIVSLCLYHQLTPWLMEPRGSMLHSQGQPNQPNSSYWYLFQGPF